MAGTDGKGDRLSPSLARRIKTNLGMLLGDAQENGLVARNVARGSKRRRHGTHEERGGKLKVGVDIPTPSEIRGLLEAAKGLARPFRWWQYLLACGLPTCAGWLVGRGFQEGRAACSSAR